MSALMIATFTVKDPDKFAEYAAKAKPTWSSLGAEALYRGRAQKVLTGGETDHEVVVVFRFPSLETIEEWYDSDAYEPLKTLRQEGADFRMTSYEILD